MNHSFLRKLTLYVAAFSMFSVIVLLCGCSAGPQEPDQPKPTVITTIYGQVVDEAGAPLAGVTVSSGMQTGTTNNNGLFVLKNTVVPENRLVVTAKKSGYFNAARAEVPKVNGATGTKLFMMSNTATHSISASSGGTVNVAGGASIKFEASSFKTALGASYSGTVSVAARYLDPSSMSFGDFFSGDNLAQSTNGIEVALISCGVLRVEVTGQSGEALQLDAAKPATISYPLPSLNTTAPNSMPLWYYDESLGMWKEEGIATLQAGKYVGTVTHFTDWNLDYMSGDNGTLVFRIVCNGAPIEGVAVKIGGFDHKTGYTGADGTIRFVRVPADKEIEIFVRAEDNDGLFYINTPVKAQLVPNQITNIGDIALNSPCPAILQGQLVGCEGENAEGLVTVSYGTEVVYSYAKTGQFALQVPSGTQLVVNAMDVAGNNATPIDILPLTEGEQRDLGTITICGPKTTGYDDIELGLGPNQYVTSLAFSPDATLLAACISDGKILIYESSTVTKIGELTTAITNRYSVRLQFSMDNKRLLVVGQHSDLEVYDVQTSTKLMTLNKVIDGFISDDGATVIAISMKSADGVAIYSADGSFIKKLTLAKAPSDSTGGAGYLRSENSIVYYDQSTKSFKVWSIDSDAETRSFPSGSASNWPSIIYSEDGSRIAMTTEAKKYAILNAVSGVQMTEVILASLQGSTSKSIFITADLAYGPEFVGGGRIINMYSTSDGALKGWRLAQDNDFIGVIAANRSDDYLGAVTKTGIRIWKLK